jgi:hypothetical protein
MYRWRVRLAAVAITAIATIGLVAAPAQAASVDYSPILTWPGNTKIGDRWTIYFDRNETGNIAGGGAGAAVGLLRNTSLPGWVVGSAASGVTWYASQAVSQSGKCATLRVEILWGWLPNVSAWIRNC